MSNHFQQRMPWLPQRWRTQRNAIRHANCKIQWVIKTLNATCTSFGKYVCWSVCSIPTKEEIPRSRQSFSKDSFRCKRVKATPRCVNYLWTNNENMCFWWIVYATIVVTICRFPCMTWFERKSSCKLKGTWQITIGRSTNNIETFWNRISNQTRLPPEFKHINKGRKRK